MQIPVSEWEDVRGSVLRMLAGSSSRSSKPAIFGAAPAPDEGGPRRPLGSAREGDAVALEVAAAEMAQAAAALVAIERTIMSATEKGVSPCCFMCMCPTMAPCSGVRNQELRCHGWYSWTGLWYSCFVCGGRVTALGLCAAHAPGRLTLAFCAG